MSAYSFIRRFAAILLGGVLLVGSIFKIIDPVGASLVMSSYLSFLHLGFLGFASGFLAVVFNAIEAACGIALVTGVYPRIFRTASLVLMVFFTFLTLLLYIFNPSMDCGCFGEIVHLTHAQSFWKNIVLLGLWAVAFLPYKRVEQAPKRRVFTALMALVMVGGLEIYQFRHLPVIDLTDLKIGTELSEGMVSLRDVEGEYRDKQAMYGRVLLISVYRPDRADMLKIERARRLGESAGFKVIEVYNGTIPGPQRSRSYFGDYKALKSLNRSNAGVSYVSDGMITRKWTLDSFLGMEEDALIEMADFDPVELIAKSCESGRISLGAFSLVVFLLLFL